MESVMRYERSVVIMTLLRFNYLVYSLGNSVDDTSTETDLRRISFGPLFLCSLNGHNS